MRHLPRPSQYAIRGASSKRHTRPSSSVIPQSQRSSSPCSRRPDCFLQRLLRLVAPTSAAPQRRQPILGHVVRHEVVLPQIPKKRFVGAIDSRLTGAPMCLYSQGLAHPARPAEGSNIAPERGDIRRRWGKHPSARGALPAAIACRCASNPQDQSVTASAPSGKFRCSRRAASVHQRKLAAPDPRWLLPKQRTTDQPTSAAPRLSGSAR